MALTDSLLSGVKSFITPEFVKRAGAVSELSPRRTQSGIDEGLSQLGRAVLEKGSNANGAGELIKTIRDGGYDDGVPSNYLDRLRGGTNTADYLKNGSELLGIIFGSRIGSFSVPSIMIMSLIAPLFMGVLGTKVKQQGYSVSAMMSFMGARKLERVERPAGLERQRPPLESPRERFEAQHEKRHPEQYEVEQKPKRQPSRAFPLTLVTILIVGGLLLVNLHKPEVTAPVQRVEQRAGAVRQAKPVPPVTNPLEQQLNEARQAAKQAEQSANQIARATDPVGAYLDMGSNAELPMRFDEKGLHFSEGTTRLTAGSGKTLDQLATDLRTHPRAKIRLEGYTDNTGTNETNINLSLARANVIKNELQMRGVNPHQLKAVGLGGNNPVASDDTEQGREENRRTEVIVVSR